MLFFVIIIMNKSNTYVDILYSLICRMIKWYILDSENINYFHVYQNYSVYWSKKVIILFIGNMRIKKKEK